MSALRAIERRYLSGIIAEYGFLFGSPHLELRGDAKISLAQVFVPLTGIFREPLQGRTDTTGDSESSQPAKSPPLGDFSTAGSSSLQAPEFSDTQEDLRDITDANLHVVLLGGVGSGKTTVLRLLTLEAAKAAFERADKNDRVSSIPILLHGKRYQNQILGGQKLEELLVNEVNRFVRDISHESSKAFIKELLSSGRATVLVDELDEISETVRDELVSDIRVISQVDSFSRNRFVIASRRSGFRGIGPGFIEVDISPLQSRKEILEFMRKWLIVTRSLDFATASRTATEYAINLDLQPALAPALANPLFLTILVSRYPDPENLPASVAQVYRRFIEEDSWIRAKSRIEPRWSKEECLGALKRMAWDLQFGEWADTTDAVVSRLREAFPSLKDVDGMLNFLNRGMGLLTVYQDGIEDRVAFALSTFQEYFVGRALADWWSLDEGGSAWPILKSRLHHPSWKEPLTWLSVLLDRGDADAYINRIFRARSPFETSLHRDKLFVGLCIARGARVGASTRTMAKLKLLSVYLEANDAAGAGLDRDQASFYPSDLATIEWLLRGSDPTEVNALEAELVSRIVFWRWRDKSAAYLDSLRREIRRSRQPAQPEERSLNHRKFLEAIREVISSLRDPFRRRRIPNLGDIRRDAFWSLQRRSVAAIRACGQLRIRTERVKRILLASLESPLDAKPAAVSLVKLWPDSSEIGNALILSQAALRRHAGWTSTVTAIVESAGTIAKTNEGFLDRLLEIVGRPDSSDEGPDVHYPAAWALCKAAETNRQAMSFVLETYKALADGRNASDLKAGVRRGVMDGRSSITLASLDIIEFLLNDLAFDKEARRAQELLEPLLSRGPVVRCRSDDAVGSERTRTIDLSEVVLRQVAANPPGVESYDFAMVSLLARWSLRSPRFLIKLISTVQDLDPKLMAIELRRGLNPLIDADKDEVEAEREGYELSIDRLLGGDTSDQHAELAKWVQIAGERDNAARRARSYLLHVRQNKCFILHNLYADAYRNFWDSFAWEQIGSELDTYSFGALACFADWRRIYPYRDNGMSWEELDKELEERIDLGESVLRNHDSRVVSVVESVLLDDHPILDYQIPIAAAYTMARLSRDHPEAEEKLLTAVDTEALSELGDPDLDELVQEHLVRSLSQIHQASKEAIERLLRESEKNSYIAVGIEDIENPSKEATSLLLESYGLQTDDLRASVLKALSTVYPHTEQINGLMLNEFSAYNPWTARISAEHLGSNATPSRAVIDAVLNQARSNVFAAFVIARLAPSINPSHHGIEVLGRLKKYTRYLKSVTTSATDEYRFALARLAEQLTVHSENALPINFNVLSAAISSTSTSQNVRVVSRILIGAIIGAVFAVTSNLIASYLQIRYELISDRTRVAIVIFAFIVSMIGGILIARWSPEGNRSSDSL